MATKKRVEIKSNLVSGPTPERLIQAGEFRELVGKARSERRYIMLDDSLGRSLVRGYVSREEYTALRQYALHGLASGLQGHLASVDPNRILAAAFESGSRLIGSESEVYHKRRYEEARDFIGTRPAFVADRVACYDCSVPETAVMLGYRSPSRGREKVVELLREAGLRLQELWRKR